MQYLISFLEGVITFISPCLLPMLPVYISYFAGGNEDKRKTIKNALGFVLGFTIVFVLLGAFAGSIGMILKEHSAIVNLITGGIVILFGLHYLGILHSRFLSSNHKVAYEMRQPGFLSSVLFGIVFSIGWTPCVGAFLGSALMMASQKGTLLEGMLLLITYSTGLGTPFILSALLLDRLKSTFQFIKNHYAVINKAAGIFLILIGIAMITGGMGYIITFFS